MVRTQIQLTNQQSKLLKSLALEEGISIAELIRRSVDQYLGGKPITNREELKRQAVSIVGKYSSGQDDIGINHDKYLAEIYAESAQ